ncbi:MAG TPA: trypsin-like peptidase domain-containing protein [Planctomycetaceae bacterium]|nr:trypsin-like peptidase domain-containing protein [Planctomycetaceae bacterium]
MAGASAGRMLLPTTAYELPSMPAARPSRLFCFRGQALAACSAALLLCLSPAWAVNNARRTAIVVAVEEAKQAVVNIHGRKSVRGGEALADGKHVNGMGTGIILDPRGYIITNHHVIDGVANIQVTLSDTKSYPARIIAHDPKTDLAIVKIDTKDPLPVIRLGTSNDLMQGESVIAMGNAFGYEHTVTRGIISALHRSVQVSDEQKYHDLIQTDAPINPGNSGGPLMNIEGQTIGINVAVRVGAQGIGFAIPIDEAMEVAQRLLSVERLEGVSHGIAGVTTSTAEAATFTVRSIKADSPAAKAGLQEGDVITIIGERVVQRGIDFELGLLGRKRGEPVTVEVDRAGETKTLSLSLAEGKATTVVADDVSGRVWTDLGLKLTAVNEAEFRALGTRYRGGLKITSVRQEGPAAQQGIRKGDVLVGMHIWETITMDNVTYILDRDDFTDFQPLKFFIVRGSETLYGHLRVARR